MKHYDVDHQQDIFYSFATSKLPTLYLEIALSEIKTFRFSFCIYKGLQ